MSSHIVELPKAFFWLRLTEALVAFLVFCLGAYLVSQVGELVAVVDFLFFVSIYTCIILVYYLVALKVKAANVVYNWILLLVLECIAVIFWLSLWASLAAVYALLDELLCGINQDVCEGSEIAENNIGILGTIFDVWKAVIFFGLVNFVLYCVTLGYFCAGIHRHRKAKKPIFAKRNRNDVQMANSPVEPYRPKDAQDATWQQPMQQPVQYHQGWYASPVPADYQPPMRQQDVMYQGV